MIIDDSLKYKTEEQILEDSSLSDKEKVELIKILNNSKKSPLTTEEEEDSKNILLG